MTIARWCREGEKMSRSHSVISPQVCPTYRDQNTITLPPHGPAKTKQKQEFSSPTLKRLTLKIFKRKILCLAEIEILGAFVANSPDNNFRSGQRWRRRQAASKGNWKSTKIRAGLISPTCSLALELSQLLHWPHHALSHPNPHHLRFGGVLCRLLLVAPANSYYLCVI